jgi:AraC-like DNA-binding protein
MIMQLDEGFFGSERAKAEACVNLSSSYNAIDEVQKAGEYAFQALEIIGNKPFIFLKYNAYKELSDVYRFTDPFLALTYMDSAQNNLERYHELSTTGIVDLVNTRFDLDGATRKIDQMKQDKKRNRFIFKFILIMMALFIIIYYFFFKMKKKITRTSMELVKKNITLMDQEQKVNKIIKEQKQFLTDAKIKPQLSNEQKNAILFHDFKGWLEEDKKYLKKDINLNKSATELGTNRSYLSNSINSQGIKFTELINKYRIQEVIRIFEDRDDPRNKFNLDDLAMEVGFNTKSVFFESFRKETGMTPNQFRDYTYYNKIGNS